MNKRRGRGRCRVRRTREPRRGGDKPLSSGNGGLDQVESGKTKGPYWLCGKYAERLCRVENDIPLTSHPR
jgi:hypothetical protein